MKIDVLYFKPEKGKQGADGRMSGGVASWLTGEEIKSVTPCLFARHPLKLGANAVLFVVPLGVVSPGKKLVNYRPAWMAFKDVLPPGNVITTRVANYQEKALLEMAEAYWHEFTRLEPKFAAYIAPTFLEAPKSFDEYFQKAPKPLRKNFKRDMTIILCWKSWMKTETKLVTMSAELKKNGFQVSPSLLGKIRNEYALPSPV